MSNIQSEFIRTLTDAAKIKNSVSCRIWNMPEEPDLDKQANVLNMMYLKPVLMVCPHLNFKGFHLQLECPVCDGFVVPHGWESNPAGRYVHCVEQGIYMVQYRYKCYNTTDP